MNWTGLLSFLAQHALQGALVAGASLGASGKSPFSSEGALVMATAALVSAGNHIREAPGWNQ